MDENDSMLKLVGKILSQAIPCVFSALIGYSHSTISLMFIGNTVGVVPLAAIGMANTIITMICTSLFLGFNSALDTLIS